jgi:diguanylate cyclase (GGDEF)-like protein
MSSDRPTRGEAQPGNRWLRRLQDALERPLGDLEPAYRLHFLKTDIDQATIGLSMLAVPMVLFAFADYMVVGMSSALGLMTVMRLAFLSVTVWAIVHLRRTVDPAEYDRLVSLWSIIAIVNAFAMNALRPPNHTQYLGIQCLALLAMYLVIPTRFSTRVLVAGIVTTLVAVMQLTGRREADVGTQALIWVTVTLANVMGVALSARLQTLRREQYLGRVEIERTRDELYALATIDALTGLLNRRRLLELAEQDLARAVRYGRPLSLIAIDLDHFKQVNDRYGHAAGDVVLGAVADVLRAQTRQHDLVGRIGGEEIAVILPETGLEAARQLAQRIRQQIGALMPVVDCMTISVTVSLGVAEAGPEDVSIQDTLKRADRALYRAKDRGRDRVEAA